MAEEQFVHLHVHTDYSLLDGMADVKELTQAMKADGQPAGAITDHGSLGGAVQFYNAAQKAGIKPIIGYEAYHVPDHKVKAKLKDGKANWHLIMLAQNEIGYKNLMRMSSIANTDGLFNKWGRLDDEILSQYSEGIIATSACLGSRVNQALMEGDRDAAVEYAGIHKEIFGADNYFIEVQDHGIPEQLKILEDQVWLSKKIGVGLVATNDCHFIDSSESDAHKNFIRIGTGGADLFDSQHNYLKSSKEMWELFPEDKFPGACRNTVEIANRIDFEMDLEGKAKFPQFDVPCDFEDSSSYLREIVYENAKVLYGNDDGVISKKVTERIDYELGVIDQMGFNDYFLILADALIWARAQSIAIGPGRGSGAGSVAVYCCRITDIDPIEHGLYFERFLNPGRASDPDLDIDIEDTRRHEVVNYVVNKYGKERVGHIATYGVLKARNAVRDITRVMGHPVSTANNILSKYPPAISQVSIPLEILMRNKKDVPSDWTHQWKSGAEFRKAVESNKDYKEIVSNAISVEGSIRNTGIHAAGIIVTPTALWDMIPISSQSGAELYVCEYDKKDAEAVGGLKIDFLGLTSLSMIQRTLYLIQSDLNRRIDISKIPMNDPAVFEMLTRGETEGVFQLSESAGTDTITRIAPTSFQDISAAIALARPGPMGTNMHIEYADRKNGRTPIQSFHPDMSKMLENELGLPFYQENIMALSQHFAGYTASEADSFRKAMGAKDADVMHGEQEKFLEGVKSQGFKESLGQQLWEIIEPFSGYAFNKSHSVAYATISYQTAWLKAHFPAQYAAATIDIMPQHKVPLQIEFCRKHNIQLYAPDINKSEGRARTSKDAIWLGMSGIARCGESVIEAIQVERNANGPFESLGDFLVRTRGKRVNVASVRNLIYVGAFDSLHGSRKIMDDNLDSMMADATNMSNDEDVVEDGLFDFSDEIESPLDAYILDGDDYTRQQKAKLEMEVLGFFVGRHPFTEYQDRIEEAKEQGILPQSSTPPDREKIDLSAKESQVYGILTGVEHAVSKNKKPYSRFMVETEYKHRLPGIIFGMKIDKTYQGHLVLVTGEVEEDLYGDETDGLKPLQMKVREIKPIQLDKMNGRTARRFRLIKGDLDEAPSEPSTPDTESDPEAEPKKVETPSKLEPKAKEPKAKEPSKYRFIVTDQNDLQSLSQLLGAYGPGDNPVLIHYMNKDVGHDKLKFDLDDDKVQYIADQLGVRYKII